MSLHTYSHRLTCSCKRYVSGRDRKTRRLMEMRVKRTHDMRVDMYAGRKIIECCVFQD